MSKPNIFVACLALISGFLGGCLGGHSAATAAAGTVVRATRFELIDVSGRVVARLGYGDDHGTAIQFLGSSGQTQASFGMNSAGTPLLYVNGPDGKNRFALQFVGAEANPQVVLSDAKWEGRVLLGNYMSGDSPPAGGPNWGLRFAGPEHVSGIAGVGTLLDPETGHTKGQVFAYDSRGKWVSFPEATNR